MKSLTVQDTPEPNARFGRITMSLHRTEGKFGHIDTKSFRNKWTQYKLKWFRDIIKVDLIHVESRFDSTQTLCSQLFSGPTGAKITIPVSQ